MGLVGGEVGDTSSSVVCTWCRIQHMATCGRRWMDHADYLGLVCNRSESVYSVSAASSLEKDPGIVMLVWRSGRGVGVTW